MSNRNTIADVILQQNNGQPLTLAATTTLHSLFPLANGSAAQLTLPNPFAAIDASAPFPSRSAQAIPFTLRVGGTVVGGEKFQVDLVLGTGVISPVIASTGLAAGGLTNDNWLLQIEAMWDSASTFLRGIYWGWIGGNQVAQASLIGSPKATSLSALVFGAALTIATANANASVSVTEFSADFE